MILYKNKDSQLLLKGHRNSRILSFPLSRLVAKAFTMNKLTRRAVLLIW